MQYQVELSVDGGHYYSTTTMSYPVTFPGCEVCPTTPEPAPPLCCVSDTDPIAPKTTFIYYVPPVVLSVSPVTGTVQGNTNVIISGLNFQGSGAEGMLKCRFGSETVPALFSSSTQVSCLSPNVVSSGGPQD
eukprot:COSAG04_NODE_20408_length_394_cov_0.908475_1_plen_131_part_11